MLWEGADSIIAIHDDVDDEEAGFAIGVPDCSDVGYDDLAGKVNNDWIKHTVVICCDCSWPVADLNSEGANVRIFSCRIFVFASDIHQYETVHQS